MALEKISQRNFVEKCWDSYVSMPFKKQDELIIKVSLIAVAVGVISLLVFPLAPIVAVVAGAGAFCYYTDQYTAKDCGADILLNFKESFERFIDENDGYKEALKNRGVDTALLAENKVSNAVNKGVKKIKGWFQQEVSKKLGE